MLSEKQLREQFGVPAALNLKLPITTFINRRSHLRILRGFGITTVGDFLQWVSEHPASIIEGFSYGTMDYLKTAIQQWASMSLI